MQDFKVFQLSNQFEEMLVMNENCTKCIMNLHLILKIKFKCEIIVTLRQIFPFKLCKVQIFSTKLYAEF